MTYVVLQFLSPPSPVPVPWNLTAVSLGYSFVVCIGCLRNLADTHSCQRTIHAIVKVNSESGTKCSSLWTLFWLEIKLMPSGCRVEGLEASFKAPFIHKEKGARIGGGIRPCHFSALSLRCLGHKWGFLLTINLFFSLILSHSQLTFTTIISWSCRFIGL